MWIHVRGTPHRAALLAVLVVVLLVGTLHLGEVPRPAYADGDTGTCTLGPSGTQCPTTAPPAELLGPAALAAASDEQAESLRRLSDQAIDNTLADHGLPGSDRAAAASWGRADAQAELYALVVKAVDTPAADRTPDEQNAVDWLTGLVRAKAERAAQHAGAEYATWAGLDLNSYWNLVKDPATTEADLTAFLSTPISPYNTTDPSKATSGYCVYQPPEAYRDDYEDKYDNSTFQTCYTPCTSPFGCTPVTPTYDDFVDWGKTAADSAEPASAELGQVAYSVAAAIGFGVAGAAVALSAASVPALSVLLLVTGLESAVLPAFGSALVVEGMLGVAESAYVGSAGLAAGSAATAVAGTVAVVILAVVIAVLEGIKVGDASALPGKLAQLVVGARTADPGLAAQLDDSTEAAGVFALFAQATLPMPRLGGSCDGTTTTTELGTRPCLNPPVVPAPAETDPHFVVRDVSTGDTSVSPSITLADPATSSSATVRVHGSWFVGTDPATGQEVQSLGMGYPDQDGTQQRVWLVRDTDGGYQFIGSSGTDTAVDPDTCEASGTCWARSGITYVGTDGRSYRARVEPYAPPTGTPIVMASAAGPVEAAPVTFSANGFQPADAVAPVSYSWRFQKEGCGFPCTTTTSQGGPSGGASTGPAYGSPVAGSDPSGDHATHTWQTSGTFAVEVTATDSWGRQTATSFPVTIAGVPPVLTVDPPSTPGSVGSPSTLRATVDHAGSLDDETVEIDWGDGNRDTTAAGPNTLTFVGSPATMVRESETRYTLTASHSYAQAGTYAVTVSVVDNARLRDSTSLTYTVSAVPDPVEASVGG